VSSTIVSRAQGHIPIRFFMKQDGKASLAIYNQAGQTVRTCVGAQPYEMGDHTYMWDGLSDRDNPVPQGKYIYKILTHKGIHPRLVCNIGVSGTPPYQTEDETGGWAGDYRTPWIMANADERIVLGTTGCEAAPMLIVTDLTGKRLFPVAAMGRVRALGLRDGFGYAVTQNGKLVKFSLADGQLAPFENGKSAVEIYPNATAAEKKAAGWWCARSVAFVGDDILIANSHSGIVYVVKRVSGKLEKELKVAKVVALTVTPDDKAYVISDKVLGRLNLKTGEVTHIKKDLDEPQMLASDMAGNIYVSLWGKTMQVWKLSPQGKVLQKYGANNGRPMIGKFNPHAMLNPQGIAVDKNGRLWVAEADDVPKRYSVWTPKGKLYEQFFGSLPYSTRACIDPEDPERIYVEGVQYGINYKTGEWKVMSTLLRNMKLGNHKIPGLAWTNGGNHRGGEYVRYKGRRFFYNHNGPVLYEVIRDEYVPRMMTQDKGKKLWVDSNNDGNIQEEEIKPTKYRNMYFGLPMDQNLNLISYEGKQWAAQGQPKATPLFTITRLRFHGFNKQGGLDYGDPMQFETVATDEVGGKVADLYEDVDGTVYALIASGTLDRGERVQGAGHRVVKYAADGKKLWEYRNVECAFAWNSKAYSPGFIVSAMLFPTQRSKKLLAVTGYYGQYFFLDKETGLFVDAIGEDQRSAYTMGPHMVLVENFNGNLYDNHEDGRTYFIGGDCDARLWELQGLDGITRQTGKVKVSKSQFELSEKNAEHNLQVVTARTGKKTAKLKRLAGAAADGKYREWGNIPLLPIYTGEDRSAVAQAGYDDNNLYIRFQVNDESPLSNTARDYKRFFKTGDALELQFGDNITPRNIRQGIEQTCAHDIRLIVVRNHEGKMQATLLRYQTQGKKPNQVIYESHWKQVVDEVIAVDDLAMHCKMGKKEYVVEVAVPWTLLQVKNKVKSGTKLTGDFGVIYGNKGGTRNAIRYMWSDQSPEVSINNDIPSEVRIHPNQWGRLILE